MRPSFHCATGWPCSAAYWSAVSAVVFPGRVSGACAPPRKASPDDKAAVLGVVVPSKAYAGAAPKMRSIAFGRTPEAITTVRPRTPNAAQLARRRMALDVGIAHRLGRSAWVGQRAVTGGSNLLGVFPQITGSELGSVRLPFLGAFIKLRFAELDVERAALGIERDGIAVANVRDGATDRGFRPDMADAEAARRAGEAAIGNQRDLGAHALSVECSRGRQHLAHAGSALGPLVADHQDVAFLVLTVFHCFEAGFLTVEAARRTGELQTLHACHFHDRAFGCEIALEADDTAGRQ